jgi:hypothetical protein
MEVVSEVHLRFGAARYVFRQLARIDCCYSTSLNFRFLSEKCNCI